MDEDFKRDMLKYKLNAGKDYRQLVRLISCKGCSLKESCDKMPKDCFVEKEKGVENGL